MKKTLVCLLLSACSYAASNEIIRLFDTNIMMNSVCSLSFTKNETTASYSPVFSEQGDCRIVTHPESNVPHIEFINGMYIFFVENNLKLGNSCKSEYTAMGVTKTNEVRATRVIKKSSSCYQAREIQAYQYFSTKLNAKDKIL
ncbi:hypothetical protein [Litoribacillus peritrichatus]